MASAGARAYNGGLGAELPAESMGRAPGQGSGGEAPPPEAEKLFNWNVQRRGKFVPFSALSVVNTIRQR